ncbi:MAG: hypothetical protein ACREPC_13830 [Stenotrophomonas sp.]|uniref:hypothetical protein n=1 Tax=Stenotrophomonas sp. TaxID=69392 RepID=UPI003D6D7A66
MSSPADPARLATLVVQRVQRLRREAASHSTQAADHEQQAHGLRTQADLQLREAQLGEEHGLDRQRLFDRLRTVAIARAHVLECDLRASDLQQQAAQAREREHELRQAAIQQQSRARRLQAVGERIEQKRRQAQRRRHERTIQEEYTCR